MNFKQIKKDFRKMSVKHFTDMESFEQEELNAFLFYFNQCKTEDQIMKVLDDWCITITTECRILRNMTNKKYYINHLIDEINDSKEEYKYNLLNDDFTIDQIDDLLCSFDTSYMDEQDEEEKISMLKIQLYRLYNELHDYY